MMRRRQPRKVLKEGHFNDLLPTIVFVDCVPPSDGNVRSIVWVY